MVKSSFLHRQIARALFLMFSVILFVPTGYTQKGLELSVDLAQFMDNKRQSYLEIYYSLPEHAIKYLPNPERINTSQIIMNMLVFRNDSLWTTKVWKIEKSFEEGNAADSKNLIVDMFRYFVDVSATYRVSIQARDLNQESSIDSVTTTIECKAYATDRIGLSSVQLASKISRVNEATAKMFVKGKYEVVPNPNHVFGEGVPELYYYFEAYNLLNNLPGEKYCRLAFLKDSEGNVVEGLGKPTRVKKKVRDRSVEFGMIDISGLPSGRYSFVYGIADSEGKPLSSYEEMVYVFNPSVAPSLSAVEVYSATGYLPALEPLSAGEVDKEYQYLKHLITQKEQRELYASSDNPIAKKKIVSLVWQANAGVAGFKISEYRDLYLTRVDEANERFKGIGREGWDTDQGRVYILYSAPTDIERIPSSASNKPYEIWTYDSLRGQGGVQFIFADRFGFRRYELIHADLRGELQDPFWQRYVLVGPQ